MHALGAAPPEPPEPLDPPAVPPEAPPEPPPPAFPPEPAPPAPAFAPPEPDDALAVMNTLWDKHRIQVASNVFQGKLLLRLSAQIYVERSDYERLVPVLERDGWPGR